MEKVTDKKEAIFRSTIELVKENGFHGTPISQIAKKAGIAAGTIYIYFESKDALMVELYRWVRGIMLEAILADDNESDDFKIRFFNVWLNHCNFYITHPDILYFLEQYVNSPYHQEKEEDCFQHKLRAFIETGIKQKSVKHMDHHLLGMFIHGTVISAAKIYLRKLKIGKEELQQVATIVWDGIENK